MGWPVCEEEPGGAPKKTRFFRLGPRSALGRNHKSVASERTKEEEKKGPESSVLTESRDGLDSRDYHNQTGPFAYGCGLWWCRNQKKCWRGKER